MRNKLHKTIDFICDIFLETYRFFIILQNCILCFFKKPKYKIGQTVYCPYNKPHFFTNVDTYYKVYKENIIYYDLGCGYNFSEGVIDFYEKKAPKNE